MSDLLKLIEACEAKMNEGYGGFIHQPERVHGGWVLFSPGGSVEIAQCDNELNARNIAALHNGYRAQLDVADELAHSTHEPTLATIELMLTPLCEALGVQDG